MNSETLSQTFPDVYREFFSKCSTVVSAPGSFFWSAGLAVIYGGIGILQKIPLRVYIGIERDSYKDLRFGDYFSFVPNQRQFEKFIHDKIYEAKFIKLVNDLRRTLPQSIGGKIHILSEVPRGAGLNQSAAINMALSTLLGLETGLLTRAKLTELVTLPTPDIQHDPVFNRLFRLAWKLEAMAHSDIGSGSGPYTAFIDSSSPIIFFSERRQGNFTQHPYSRFPSDVEGHYEIFDKVEYAGYRTKELFSWRGEPSWPVDYGLIYLGQKKHSSIYLRPMLSVKESLDEMEHFASQYFKRFPTNNPDVVPSFYNMTQANKNRGYWEKSVSFLIMLSAKAVGDLKALIENSTAEALEELCSTVQLQENIYEFFTKGLPATGEKDTLVHIKQLISEKAHNGLQSIRFLPDRPDGGGDLLFMAPEGCLHDHMNEFQNLLRTHISPLVRFDYASWLDGVETDGVRLNQHLLQGLYSPFISHGTVSLVEWHQDKVPSHRVYSIEAFTEEKTKVDLLLDSVEHCIFVRGKLLNSKQIKSAKATIEILKVLLNHLGEEVPAVDLPPSAYIERNEMQSKIISPLAITFKRLTGKKLPLSLKGALRKNFTIKFAPADISVSLLERQT